MASGTSRVTNLSFLYTNTDLDIVECRVCNDRYHLQGEKVPRLLLCGHTVCHQCLTRLPTNNDTLLCPFDRQPTYIDDSGVWGLKKNFALIELLEKLQYPFRQLSADWDDTAIASQKKLNVPCDENEQHTAVLYCVTCGSNLCLECSNMTHSARTLAKHKRVPLSEKPQEYPKCARHPMHLVEFACLEEECQGAPLMCYICKDYGRHVQHKHALLEAEAANVRASLMTAMRHVRSFAEEVMSTERKLAAVVQQTEGGTQLIQAPDGHQHTVEVQGTAEKVRVRVTQYFAELREMLKRQEMSALTVVDTHIRERLCMLKQQQEDMGVLLSQITTVCHQCEKMLQEDDAKVLLAKAEVKTLSETVQTQQTHFAELPEQLQLDPNIPITFTKDNRVHIGPKMEMRVVVLGLDHSGKTSILFRLKLNDFIETIPTIGFNVETVEFKNLKFTFWDVGGQKKLRPLWKHYYLNTQALVFVVDSSDRDRMNEAFNELAKLLQEKELQGASLLIFANKQDVEQCLSLEEMVEQFNLFKLCCNRCWHIQACDTSTGAGLFDGLEWLSHQLVGARV
ncbi:hypothetical protein NP493_43g05060 [Ridgeia piscesae]|uniref:RING-type E3 ubiquitin transferase n=2 Tax=Ridgeia piscesae TaxID=27915 RepID=A0AAD9PBR4_RIDPI|nr:hypothetical protein NP493_43g05060 [Ridgeia piscesae]